MQAVLVIAHKNIEHVIELSQQLRKQFEVYIHIDKKCNVSGLQMNELFNIGEAPMSTKAWMLDGGDGALRKLLVFCLEKP